MSILRISRKIRYRTFGFLPRKHFWYNLYGGLFGNPNLIKRLQAPDIVHMLELQVDDRVLDFGCGTGFFTVEFAKHAAEAHGIDINPRVEGLQVPDVLDGKLNFKKADGRRLPYSDAYFDKIFASEVIGFISNRDLFFEEFQRLLAVDGTLVVCNSAGHPAIEKAYQKKSLLLSLLRRIRSAGVPHSVEDYYNKISSYFGNEKCGFLSLEEIKEIAGRNGFAVIDVAYTPRNGTGIYLSWLQFVWFVFTGRPLLRMGFMIHYPILSFLGSKKTGYPGGLLLRIKRCE